MTRVRLDHVLPGLLATGLTGILAAHGGQYRGPLPSRLAPPAPSSTPATPPPPAVPPPTMQSNPAPTPTGGPRTPGAGLAPDLSRWQLWWEMNKDRYLLVKQAVRSFPVTGEEEFYLGATRRPVAVAMAPTDKVVTDVIVPRLYAALQDTNDPHLVTACLVGLAKIGVDPAPAKLRDVFERYLPAASQEVRETAALALGIARQPGAAPVLSALLLDTPAGRKLAGRREVDRRVRAFAAYGLGILASHGDADLRAQAFATLNGVLQDDAMRDRDIQVAVIGAIGVLKPDPAANPKDKRLLWQALPALHRFYERDLGRARQLVQAHVPVAVGRLLGRGDSADHERFIEHYAGELSAPRRRDNAIPQSAAIALGRLASAEREAVSDRLHRYYESGRDQQARYFSLIALGEIGGDRNRTRLLRALMRGHKAIERPWAALALGVLAHRQRTAGAQAGAKIDTVIGDALLRQLTSVKNREAAGAFAVALGLAGHTEAGKPMRALLLENQHHDELAGSLCTGLALMDDREGAKEIRFVLYRSVRRPDLLRQAAVALGRLQDRSAARDLLDMLSDGSKSTARMASIAGALRFIGDRRTVDGLVQLLRNRDLTSLARAFAAAALGGIGDPLELPFAARYAGHSNYRAAVETLVDGATGILDLL